jgi:hypothetical protein
MIALFVSPVTGGFSRCFVPRRSWFDWSVA